MSPWICHFKRHFCFMKRFSLLRLPLRRLLRISSGWTQRAETSPALASQSVHYVLRYCGILWQLGSLNRGSVRCGLDAHRGLLIRGRRIGRESRVPGNHRVSGSHRSPLLSRVTRVPAPLQSHTGPRSSPESHGSPLLSRVTRASPGPHCPTSGVCLQ